MDHFRRMRFAGCTLYRRTIFFRCQISWQGATGISVHILSKDFLIKLNLMRPLSFYSLPRLPCLTSTTMSTRSATLLTILNVLLAVVFLSSSSVHAAQLGESELRQRQWEAVKRFNAPLGVRAASPGVKNITFKNPRASGMPPLHDHSPQPYSLTKLPR